MKRRLIAVRLATLPRHYGTPIALLLDVAAKHIRVKMTNSGYKKAGG